MTNNNGYGTYLQKERFEQHYLVKQVGTYLGRYGTPSVIIPVGTYCTVSM